VQITPYSPKCTSHIYIDTETPTHACAELQITISVLAHRKTSSPPCVNQWTTERVSRCSSQHSHKPVRPGDGKLYWHQALIGVSHAEYCSHSQDTFTEHNHHYRRRHTRLLWCIILMWSSASYTCQPLVSGSRDWSWWCHFDHRGLESPEVVPQFGMTSSNKPRFIARPRDICDWKSSPETDLVVAFA